MEGNACLEGVWMGNLSEDKKDLLSQFLKELGLCEMMNREGRKGATEMVGRGSVG